MNLADKQNISQDDQWTEVISSERKWFDFKFQELWRYRDLIFMFVNRDFLSVYKQTILGPIWFFIQPLLTTIVFSIVFGTIARLSTDGLPPMLFYMSGIVSWSYFSSCLNKTSGTFLNNAGIFGKVYFPRLAIPISNVIGSLISFGIQFAFFLIFLLYYKFVLHAPVNPNIYILITPLLLAIMAALGLGIGIIISSFTIKYRDLNFLIAFAVQLLMYATPVIYPVSSVPAQFKAFIYLNPLTAVVESFRYAFLGAGTIHMSDLLYSAVFSLLILFVGVALFNRVERTFMDTV